MNREAGDTNILAPFTAPSWSAIEGCKLYTCMATTWLLAPICVPCNVDTIQDYERGVRMRLGKRMHDGVLSGGMHLNYPYCDTLLKIDIRERTLDIPAQSIITKEGLPIVVDGVVYFKVLMADRDCYSTSGILLIYDMGRLYLYQSSVRHPIKQDVKKVEVAHLPRRGQALSPFIAHGSIDEHRDQLLRLTAVGPEAWHVRQVVVRGCPPHHRMSATHHNDVPNPIPWQLVGENRLCAR